MFKNWKNSRSFILCNIYTLANITSQECVVYACYGLKHLLDAKERKNVLPISAPLQDTRPYNVFCDVTFDKNLCEVRLGKYAVWTDKL